MKQKSIKVNAILNLFRQVCVILFPMITFPYVSRILGPENYGKLNFSDSIAGYVSLIAGLGIGSYAVREGSRLREKREQFNQFANEMVTIHLLSTLVAYVILLIAVMVSAKLRNYWRLLLIQNIGLIIGVWSADWINTVYEDYLYITIRYILFQALALVMMFTFVHQPEDYVIYAVTVTLAGTGGSLANIFYIRRYAHLRITAKPDFRRHMGPILLLFFNSIAQVIYLNSDITMLGYLQNETSVGIYAMVSKIYRYVKLLFNALVAVIIPRLTLHLAKEEIGEYRNLLQKVENALFTVLLPGMVGLFFLGEEAIWVMGGEDYIVGLRAMQILSIALLFAVLSCLYCTGVLIPHRLERLCLKISTISAVVNVVLNLVLIPVLDYNGAALTTLLSEIIVFVYYFAVSRKYPHNPINRKVLTVSVLGCVLVAVVCMLCKALIDHVILRILVAMTGSCIAYFGFSLLAGNAMVREIAGQVLDRIRNRL